MLPSQLQWHIKPLLWGDHMAWGKIAGGGVFDNRSAQLLAKLVEKGVKVYDTFDRSDSASIGTADTGQIWTEDVGDLQISGNLLKTTTVSSGQSICSLESGLSNGRFSLTVNIGADLITRNVGVIFRMTDANNFWVARPSKTSGGAGSVQIVKCVSGVFTTVANISATVNANTEYSVMAVANNDIISLYFNGSLITEITDNFNATATKAGVRFGTTGTPASLYADKFSVEVL